MSNPWDADLKKYRAKRMSVSGHVQPNSFAMNKQSQVLQIDALVESDDDVDEESEDDDDTHSIQRSVDQAESSGLPENAPGTPLSVTSGFEVASPSIDSTNKSPPTDPSLIPPPSTPSFSGSNYPTAFFPSTHHTPSQPDDINVLNLPNPPEGEEDAPQLPLALPPDQEQEHVTALNWIELQASHDPSFRLYYNKSSKETTSIKPQDYVAPPSITGASPAAFDMGFDFQFAGDSSIERLQQCIEQMSKYLDNSVIPLSQQVGGDTQEQFASLRQQLVQLKAATSDIAPTPATTLDYLIGFDSLHWDYGRGVQASRSVQFYRACSQRTDHSAVQFQDWHLPQYFSQQPLLPTATKKQATILLDPKEKNISATHAKPRRTVLEIKQEDLVDDVVLTTVQALLDENTNPSDYVLKVLGHREFLTQGHAVFSYEHVRKTIRDCADLVFVLVQCPQLDVSPKDQEVAQQRQDLYSDKINHSMDEYALNMTLYQDLQDLSRIGYEELLHLTHIPMSSLNVPFNVRIVGIDNLNSEALPRFTSEITHVYIRAVLFHGCSDLPFAFETTPQEPAETLNVQETLYGGPTTTIALLPRETRIGYVVYGRRQDGKELQLGCVVNQLVNEQGEMLSGPVKHSIWGFPANADGKKVGGKRDKDPFFIYRCVNWDNLTKGVQTTVVHVEYPKFKHPVVAPLVSRFYEPNTKLIGVELQKPLDKQQSLQLLRILDADPLFPLTTESKQLLWNTRHFLIDMPAALPKILACIDWARPDYRNEAYRMLQVWAVPPNPVDALEFLDARFGDYRVREYAVSNLRLMNDEDLQLVLLQLVQCIKYEPYHDSPLSRFLIERAIACPYQIGHTLYWHLKAEVHDPQVSERFVCILEELLCNIGVFVEELYKQAMTVSKLQKVAEHVARLKREFQYTDEETMVHYKQMLQELNDKFFKPQGKFQIPLNPKCEGTQLIVEKCKYMSSKMVPLWLVFQNADPEAPPIYLIFKSGDDLRQDLLTLQILRIMDHLWLRQNLDMRLKPYNVIATGVNEQGEGVGMIEVVLNSDTTSSIQVKYGGGAHGALKSEPIDMYLRDHNKDPTTYTNAVTNFVHSCAGYCVATFVLGIGDRHNGNIMVTKSGHLFHIDFGHFLGNFKKKFGVNRERAAFVFTPEMAYVMGGKDYKKSEFFKQFKNLCSKSFKVLRQHATLLETLFVLMVAAGMPELLQEKDINYLRNKLYLDLDNKHASKELQEEIKKSLDSKYRRVDNYIHNLKHTK